MPVVLNLQDAGRFWPDNYDSSNDEAAFSTFWGGGMLCWAGIAASCLFPPLAPLETYFAARFMRCWAGSMGTGLKAVSMETYYQLNTKKPQVLWPPLFPTNNGNWD